MVCLVFALVLDIVLPDIADKIFQIIKIQVYIDSKSIRQRLTTEIKINC